MSTRGLLAPGTYVLIGGTLHTIREAGKRGGAPGYYVDDVGTARPSSFAPDWIVTPAIVGDTVCESPRGTCYCGRHHVPARLLEQIRLRTCAC